MTQQSKTLIVLLVLHEKKGLSLKVLTKSGAEEKGIKCVKAVVAADDIKKIML
tara:strand:+ start:4011 stop:4169 length:159 start_codon:yes stop_codon:yes gene_type:complete